MDVKTILLLANFLELKFLQFSDKYGKYDKKIVLVKTLHKSKELYIIKCNLFIKKVCLINKCIFTNKYMIRRIYLY